MVRMMRMGCRSQAALAEVKVIAVFALVSHAPDGDKTVVAKDILVDNFSLFPLPARVLA